MNTLLLRSSLRFRLRHRWQTLLIITGIALGVAVVVAVDLANESARLAFDLSLEAVAGRTTHRIQGTGEGIPKEIFVQLRRQLGLRRNAPVVTDYVRIDGRTFTLLGIDPLSELNLGRYSAGLGGDIDLDWLARPGVVLLSRRGAETLDVGSGEEIILNHRGKDLPVTVAEMFEGDNPAAEEGLILADIAAAQELLARADTLDRIDLVLDDHQIREVELWLPASLRLVASERRNHATRQMTEAFHVNLTAMSLLALLVGGLLIYNTLSLSMLQRRHLHGIYRALGVTGSGLYRLVLVEAAVLGLVGTILGLLLGLGLARALVHLVLGTVNDLYFVLTVREFMIEPLSLLKGAGLGLGTTLVAVMPASLEAWRSSPAPLLQRSRPERFAGRLAPLLFVAGLVTMAAGWRLSMAPGGGLALGYSGLGLLVLGFCLAVPWAVSLLIKGLLLLLAPVMACSGRMALRGIKAGLSRTGMAIAALSVAVAATVAMAIMVHSFRHGVANWLDHTLAGDIQLSIPGRTSARPGPGLPPALVAKIAELPGVAAIDASRRVEVETAFGPLTLTAREDAHNLPLRNAGEEAQANFRAGESVLISEVLAHRSQLAVGDSLALATPKGEVSLPVAGIFVDYSSRRGMVALALGRYRQLWDDQGLSNISIHRHESVPQSELLDQVRVLAAAEDRTLWVRSNSEIRARSLAVFDRTFVVTRVLRLLTVIVAFVAVFGALMQLLLEQARELAILRVTGMTPVQVSILVLARTGMMGLLSGLLALPLGLLTARVLIDVINLRAFGWQLDQVIPLLLPVEGLALALVAALLAGVYPAWRAARLAPARALREE